MRTLRAVLASAWVGWEREVGWTNPVLGLLIRAAPLVATVLTAAIIYWFSSTRAGFFNPERLAFVVVGASLYAHVGAYAWLPTSAIAEGKWSNIFAHLYISPASSLPYLLGRGLASFVSSVPIVTLCIAACYYVSPSLFQTALPLTTTPTSALMVSAALLANFPAAMGLGFLLAAQAIFVGKFEWALPSYISGILMIFSEALFPAGALPWPLPLISNALPFTYLMRASRAALIPGSPDDYPTALLYLLVGGFALLALGLGVFRQSEARARRNGLLDRKVG